MGAAEQKRDRDGADSTETSETLSGTRNRAMGSAMNNLAELPATEGQRCRVGDPYVAFVVDKEIVKGHASWRNPEIKARWDATQAPAVEKLGAAISVWTAGERRRDLGQQLREVEKESNGVWREPLRNRDVAP